MQLESSSTRRLLASVRSCTSLVTPGLSQPEQHERRALAFSRLLLAAAPALPVLRDPLKQADVLACRRRPLCRSRPRTQ